jgi:hypothetical protein
MFNKTGIMELHELMHERMDLLLRHVATVPDDLTRKAVAGFGHPTICRQLVHILTCEEGWIHDLQNKVFAGWTEEQCPTMAGLLSAKERIHDATRTYLSAGRASSGVGRRTPESSFHRNARDHAHISSQGPSGRYAADPRIPGAGYGSASCVDVLLSADGRLAHSAIAARIDPTEYAKKVVQRSRRGVTHAFTDKPVRPQSSSQVSCPQFSTTGRNSGFTTLRAVSTPWTGREGSVRRPICLRTDA